MPLRVIGTGFGRTGTESMKFALEMLGFGPCHHMREVSPSPKQRSIWRTAATTGESPDWESTFAGFGACVDWPSAHYWHELADYYPDAKMLLTLRSAESWYASMSKTIIPFVSDGPGETLGSLLVRDRIFDGRWHDRDHAIEVFERNTREVQAAFGPDRLLTFEVGAGWKPLCEFLEVPIPSEPFPRSNSADEFNAAVTRRADTKPGDA
jgi:hypothetical protein